MQGSYFFDEGARRDANDGSWFQRKGLDLLMTTLSTSWESMELEPVRWTVWKSFNKKIWGTLFPHKECHKNTWYSNNHVTIAQLDHVCNWPKSLLDIRVLRIAEIGLYCLDFTRTYRKRTLSRQNFNTHKLRDSGIRDDGEISRTVT